MIAALYVQTGGCYFGLDGVDPWDEQRDALLYPGPWPVVAHPPCARWGRYWGGNPTQWPRLVRGDDDGCFAAALASVRRWGGVLEHPADSYAWTAFGLLSPASYGWTAADWMSGHNGWTCRVEQGAYGHAARKATWLYAVRTTTGTLKWGSAPGTFVRLGKGFHSAEQRRRAIKTGACQLPSHWQRAATPLPFRDLLIDLAQSVPARHAVAA